MIDTTFQRCAFQSVLAMAKIGAMFVAGAQAANGVPAVVASAIAYRTR